jgi:hypothetical protein
MKSNIRSKIRTFLELEIPLLTQKGFVRPEMSLERAKCLTGLHHRSPFKLDNPPNLNATLRSQTRKWKIWHFAAQRHVLQAITTKIFIALPPIESARGNSREDKRDSGPDTQDPDKQGH